MNTYPSIRVGVAGATGYAGQELLALLARHPNVRLDTAMSSSADSAARQRQGRGIARHDRLSAQPRQHAQDAARSRTWSDDQHVGSCRL